MDWLEQPTDMAALIEQGTAALTDINAGCPNTYCQGANCVAGCACKPK